MGVNWNIGTDSLATNKNLDVAILQSAEFSGSPRLFCWIVLVVLVRCRAANILKSFDLLAN